MPGSILEIANIITKIQLLPVERTTKFVETLSFDNGQIIELEKTTKSNWCQLYDENSVKADKMHDILEIFIKKWK